MAKTLCPSCGFSPIPEGADECPECGEPFSFLQTHKKAQKKFIDPRDSEESLESTTFGGALTGAVTAHPYPPAAAFLTGAVIWFLRASGLVVDLGEPPWLFIAAVLDLLIPVLIILNLGPAKLLAQLVAVAQMITAVWLGRDDLANPIHLLFAGHAVVLLVMVTGEPGVFRRGLGLSMAVATAAAATAVLALIGMRLSAAELGGTAQGFRMRLPAGYVALTRDEIRPALRLPPGEAVPFGDPVARVFGMLVTNRDTTVPLISGCEALHHALGGTNELRPLPHNAPPGLGTTALVYPLETGSGGVGRLACAKRADGRLVGFAVVLLGANPATGERAAEDTFDALGAGVTLP